MSLCGAVLILSLWAAASQQSGFSNPEYVAADGSGTFDDVQVWYVGQNKEIVCDISGTGLENYTVALWQQKTSGGGEC